MSQLNTMLPIPRQGIVGGINSPGITPLAPISRGAQMAQQFMQAFGQLGGAANQIGGIFQQETNRRLGEQAKLDQEYRGKAALDARTRIAEMQKEIADGKYDFLFDGEGKVEDSVRTYIEEATKGAPDAYREQYQQITMPWLTESVVRRQQGIIDQAKDEQLALGSEDISAATDTETMAARTAELRAKFKDMPETEFLNRAVVPALQLAAITGDTAKFDAATQQLNGRFPALVASLRQKMANESESRQAAIDRELNMHADNIVAGALNESTPNFDAIRTSIKAMPISEDKKYSLFQTVDSNERQQQYLQKKQTGDTIDALAQTNPSVPDFRTRIGKMQTAGSLTEAEATATIDKYARQQIELAAQNGDYKAVDKLAPELGQSADSQTYLATQRQEAISRNRHISSDRIMAGIQSGLINPNDAMKLATQAAGAYAKDPNDPNGWTPDQVSAVMNMAGQLQKFDLSMAQVQNKFTTGQGTLTPSGHDSEAAKFVGPEGLGLIDAAGQITDGKQLGAAVLRLKLIPTSTSQYITQNLAGSDPTQIAAAAEAIGVIGRGDKYLYSQIKSRAGDAIAPMIARAYDQFDRGRLTNDQTRQAAIEEIRQASKISEIDIKPNTEIMQDLKKSGIDVPAVADEIYNDYAKSLPQSSDGIWGTRWIFDPSIDPASGNINDKIQKWATDEFASLNRDASFPRDKAWEMAKEHARAKLKTEYDFVRFNDRVIPVQVDRGNGAMLPTGMRWAESFEDEAKKDIYPFLKHESNNAVRSVIGDWRANIKRASSGGQSLGLQANTNKILPYSPDDIIGMRPYLDTTPDKVGWLYITKDGDVLRDSTGGIIVWRPTDEQQRRNEELRQLLDRKERMEKDNRKSFISKAEGAIWDAWSIWFESIRE